ncbi:MAG: hypothetical protein GY859_34320 [Desulfobacterales bacterium]|nr:hypothetical protein [Desulfobacterales bacterium]
MRGSVLNLHRSFTFMIILFLTAFFAPPAAVIYVDVWSGAGNGGSWTDARTDLQDALAAAGGGDRDWHANTTTLSGSIGSGTNLNLKSVRGYGGEVFVVGDGGTVIKVIGERDS